jgi:hypothetical protein
MFQLMTWGTFRLGVDVDNVEGLAPSPDAI